jgi:hypothetical protein
MDDKTIVQHINELVDQEHTLRETHVGKGALSPEDQEQLKAIEVDLDQCWDLLRQRRARKEFGEDPDAVAPRDPDTVEGYRQ